MCWVQRVKSIFPGVCERLICVTCSGPDWLEYSAHVGKQWDRPESYWVNPCQRKEFVFNFLEKKKKVRL